MRCDDCQALLLDHLYGLLDGPEAAAVDTHLAGCAACAAAREQAAKVRGLFARAAKSSFPNVRFVPPAEPAEPVTAPPLAEPAPPATAPFGVRPARRQRVGWAAVAAVLVLTPAVVLPVRSLTGRYDAARRGADEATASFAEARAARDRIAESVRAALRPVEQRYTAARQRHDKVLGNWVAAEWATEEADRDRKLTVKVERPAAVQPGAPNELVVSVDNRGPGLPPGHVEAEVLDDTGRVLAHQRIDPAKGAQAVRIPAEVWAHLKPQSELFLAVAAIDERAGRTERTELIDRVRLFGPVYATMLVTDKATYRPGETVYFRSLTLDRVSLRPPDREQVLRFELRKVDAANPAGELVGKLEEVGAASPVRIVGGVAQPVLGPDGNPVRGVGCGSFALPADLADGDYTLVLTEDRTPATIPVPVTRTVRVRAGLPEKFRKEIGFNGTSFGTGPVKAWCELKLGDKPVADAKVTAVAEVDGVGQPILDEHLKPFAPGSVLKTGEDGKARFAFVLPRQLLMGQGARGDVRVKVTFEPADGSRPESVAKRVPITGKDVIIEFFPEGGDLIAGAPCTVYVRATTPNGQPVDVAGSVLDARGEPVAQFKTSGGADQIGANRGLGSFTFTPKANTKYTARLDQPATTTQPPFPAVKPGGVAMHVVNPVTSPGEAVCVELRAVGAARKLVVGAYVRGRLADTKQVEAKPGEPVEVKLMSDPKDPRGGVTRITVFEVVANQAEVVAVAERLVFRRPGERLNLAFSANAGRPVTAGSPVDLTVSATDERGKPVPAILWVAAVNSAVAPDPKDRSLPTHFLLAGEIRTPDDLEHADFLLTDDPKAPQNLDRVLATQGWRRFVEQRTRPVDLTQDRKTPYLPAEWLQVGAGQYRGGLEPPRDREHRRLTGEYWPGYERAAKELDAARQEKTAAEAKRSWEPAFRQATDAAEVRRQDAVRHVEAAQAAAGPLSALRVWGWVGVVGLVLLGVGSTAAAVRSRGDSRGRVLFGLAAVGAIGLAAFLATSESSVAAVAAQPIPPAPVVEIVDDPGRIKEQEGPISFPRSKGRPGNGDAVAPGNGQPVSNPPAVSPTNAVERPPPTIQRHEGPRAILDGRRLVTDSDLAPKTLPPARAPLAPDDPDRRAAERVAARQFAEIRERAINGNLTRALGINDKGEPVTEVNPGQQHQPPAAELVDVFKRVRSAVPVTPPLVVREYAAPRPRSDADEPDTVLWIPVLVLPADGKATVSFHVGSAAGYQVIVAGHTLDGRIGAVTRILPVTKPGPDKPE